jgi:hypothetical protein
MSQLGNTLGNRPLIPQLPRLSSRCVSLMRVLANSKISALLVKQNSVGAENDEDVQQECLLMPRKASISLHVQTIQKSYVTEPVVDQDNEHQKLLIDSSQ